ncbi:MAG: tetratricopeptide repeat protein, partial [Candidatus Acidiferrales bacterium]
VYTRQTSSGSLRTAVQPPAPVAEADDELPAGHPPLDLAQRWRGLQERAEANPRDPSAARDLADLLYDLERWEQAVFWYRRTLELEPKNTHARTDLATCYFHLNRHDEALAEYAKALELEPRKPQALYGLALTRLHGKKDRAGAEGAFRELKQAHPDFPGLEQLARELQAAGARP